MSLPAWSGSPGTACVPISGSVTTPVEMAMDCSRSCLISNSVGVVVMLNLRARFGSLLMSTGLTCQALSLNEIGQDLGLFLAEATTRGYKEEKSMITPGRADRTGDLVLLQLDPGCRSRA